MGSAQSKQFIVQASVYGSAPFYANPIKILLNEIYGGGYPATAAHFRRDHMSGANLVGHMLCLLYQIGGNYAFLAALEPAWSSVWESLLGGVVPSLPRVKLSHFTSCMWATHIAKTPAPLSVKLGSLGTILLGTTLGEVVRSNHQVMVMLQGVIEAAAVQRLLLEQPEGSFKMIPFLILLGLRTILYKWVKQYEGRFADMRSTVLTVIGAFLFVVGGSNLELKFKIAPLALFGWIPALLLDSPGLFFLASGTAATLCQGLSHRFSGELGTLEVLTDPLYELSHVTYFPAILLQAVRDHLSDH